MTMTKILKRTAIDFSGRLGSLYNACEDRIVATLNISLENSIHKFDQQPQQTQCLFIKGDQYENSNLLQLIDLDEQLRLSLLLNLTTKHGIGSLIDYPYLINKYTRIFRYTHIHHEENLREYLPRIIPDIHATHIITNISWGIDILFLIQLPDDDHLILMIDQILDKYRIDLNDKSQHFQPTQDDLNSIEKILYLKIYSNLEELTRINQLNDLINHILQSNHSSYERVIYTLQPIYSITNYIYLPLDSINTDKFQKSLFELINLMKILDRYLNEDMSSLFYQHFQERLINNYKQSILIKKEYYQFIDQFKKSIIDLRSGSIKISKFEKKFKQKIFIDLKTKLQNLIENVSELNSKIHLITDLAYQHIQYCNVNEREIKKDDNEQTVRRKLILDGNRDRILCSNDLLNKTNPTLLKELRRKLYEELETNSKLRLIYADFSYSNYKLNQMMIVSTNENKQITPAMSMTSIPRTPTSISASSLSRWSTAKTINILLLGETGVGKSTFINALFNYLTFKTLDNAEINKPILAIPVSFLITTGKNPNVYTVECSNSKNSKNEDFNHPGQIITQSCRSYTYNLNHKERIRLIDTPGFGDLRGFDQDNRNMQQIINYVKKYSHLNAICFLFKPNNSKINLFFRSCLSQLFNLFGTNIRENILFCFTHTRSTFYTPGNTYTIIEKILSSSVIRKISLKKINTFCFDNEAFRYLIALQNKIIFDNLDKQVYDVSWENSLMETNRLIRYIDKKLLACPIPDESQIIKCAEIKIVHLTRPLIETIRHILRNIIIRKLYSLKIVSEFSDNDNHKYQLLPYQPMILDFLENYKILNNPLRDKQDEMIDHLSLFCDISCEFAYFLLYIANYLYEDPFLNGLLRLIREEEYFSQQPQNSNYIHLQMTDCLKKFIKNYQNKFELIKINPKRLTMDDIHEWIKYISEYPLISGYIIDKNQISIV